MTAGTAIISATATATLTTTMATTIIPNANFSRDL